MNFCLEARRCGGERGSGGEYREKWPKLCMNIVNKQIKKAYNLFIHSTGE
jgi:hypothetical protein